MINKPHRYNKVTVEIPRKWWEKLLRIKPKFENKFVLVDSDSPEWEAAPYEEIVVGVRNPFVVYSNPNKL